MSEILPEKEYTWPVWHPEHFVLPTTNTVVFMNSPIIRASTVLILVGMGERLVDVVIEKQREGLEVFVMGDFNAHLMITMLLWTLGLV